MYKLEDTLYIQMSGRIEVESANAFTQEILERLDSLTCPLLVFDLKDLQGINSQILGVIVKVWQKAKGQGKTCRVLARRRGIELFRIARLESIVEIYPLDDISD